MKKKKKRVIKKRFPNSSVSVDSKFDNDTFLSGFNVICNGANVCKSRIGYCSVVGANTYLPNCTIGSFCSIADGVKVVQYTHPTSFVSTHPSFFNTINNYPFGKGITNFDEEIKLEDGHYVEIGNDVWIGKNVLIRAGVEIGDGSIVGMGAVVTKNVPPYSIVGGVPARVIRKRFDDTTINALLSIRWWRWNIDEIKKKRNEFCDIESFISKYGKRC